MKNYKISQIIYISLLLILSCDTFADVPPPFEDDVTDNTGAPAASVNDYLTVLAILGSFYAFYSTKRKSQKKF